MREGWTALLDAVRDECEWHQQEAAELHRALPEAAEGCDCDLCRAFAAYNAQEVQP